MLVLAHADGLGRDLHELGQRILEAAPQAHGAARGDVEVGILLACQLGGRVHRGAGLVHDGVAHGRAGLGDVVGHRLLGFAAARPVADDDDVDAVLLDVGGQLGLRFLYLGARRGGEDRGVVEQLAVLVQHGHLAARAVAGVERDDARPAYGTLLQEALGVLGEHADGIRLGALGELGAQVALHRRRDQALVAVRDGGFQGSCEGAVAAQDAALQQARGRVGVGAHLHFELLLLLAAVDGEDAVVGDARQGFGEVVVRLVDGLLGRVDGFDGQRAASLGSRAQAGDVLGVVGDDLGHDVLRALQRILGRGVSRFRVHEAGGQGQRVLCAAALREDEQRERLEPGVARLRGAGGALLPVRLVQVLDALHDRGLVDLRAQVGRELALLLDGAQHLVLAGFEVAHVAQALVQIAQRRIVDAAGGLLAVAGDERDGVPLVYEVDDGRDLRGGQVQLPGDGGLDG